MSDAFNIKFADLPVQHLRNVSLGLIDLLHQIDSYCGERLWVHRLHSKGNPSSQHYHGRAVDGHIEGMGLIEQYVMLERFNPGGLGLYGSDVWFNPGFHFDIREKFPTAKWGCIKRDSGEREYVALDKGFFQRIIGLEEVRKDGVG